MIFRYTVSKYTQQFVYFTQRNPHNIRESLKQTYPSNLLKHIQNTSKMLPKAFPKASKSDPLGDLGPTWIPKPTSAC